MKPKLDKARREWLDSLCDGDLVAVLDERGNVSAVDIVTWRSYSTMWGVAGRTYLQKSGKRSGLEGWIVPASDEMKARHGLRKQADAARRQLSAAYHRQWRDCGDSQLIAAATLLFPEPK